MIFFLARQYISDTYFEMKKKMLGTKKQTFALDCGLGVAVKLIWLYFTTQLKLFFLSTEIFTWFLSVLKKLFAQIFAQKYWQMFILNIQSLKVTLLPSFLKYATINSSQKKKISYLVLKEKGLI